MRFRFLIVPAWLCLFALTGLRAQSSPDETAALQADSHWLHLIDVADYPAAWKDAAAVMQSALNEPSFAKAMAGARGPLGAFTGRTLSHVQTTKQLPGAPDGLYVVAQYTAHYANKADAVETIVASQSPDGSWHVSGYFIR